MVCRDRLRVVVRQGLRASEELLDQARAALDAERHVLHDIGVEGELRLVGGTSLPGLLTYGDIDLLLRVPRHDFRAVAVRLGRIHAPRRADIWTADMALFLVDEAVPVELAMVVAGSPQDRHFIYAWDRLAHSPELRHRYNQLKLHPGDDYDARKAAFFVELAVL